MGLEANIKLLKSLLTIALSIVLFTNCSKYELRPSLKNASDLSVTGSDGQAGNPNENCPASNLKVYLNGSGDPRSAPGWAQKTIRWYYNPEGQPVEYTQSQALEIIESAMKTWEAVCDIKWVYQGVTNRSATDHTDSLSTIGWSHAAFNGATHVDLLAPNTIREADIEVSSSFEVKPKDFKAAMTHELGHQLGLGHSNVFESIMFANPYHPTDYVLTLRQDDIDGCVGLYGPPVAGSAPTPIPTAVPTPSPTPVPMGSSPVPTSVDTGRGSQYSPECQVSSASSRDG